VVFIKLLFEMKFLEQLRERTNFEDPHLAISVFRDAIFVILIVLMCLLSGNIQIGKDGITGI